MHQVKPLFFGPDDRALYGCLHIPPSWSGARIVLCGPLGYESIFAYASLFEAAAELALQASALVLRLDYDGYGDSAGSDTDPDRVPRWLASIDHAIEYLTRAAPGHGPLILVGFRAGALLASKAASRRQDITGLALWSPCASGKAFLREQRAFSGLTLANPASPERAAPPWGPRGFEANGYVFTNETVDALEALSLTSYDGTPPRRVLLVDRAELPRATALPPTWTSQELALETCAVAGYAEAMEPPWLWNRPTDAIEKLANWAARVCNGPRRKPPDLPGIEGSGAAVSPSSLERPVRFGPDSRSFGVLTEPAGVASNALMIPVTSTFGYRIGPNRMNVPLARTLATHGIATLRIDADGTGDNRTPGALPPRPPYDELGIQAVLDAIDYARSRGFERIYLTGICAGAYLAWRAGSLHESPLHMVLANPETFLPLHYDADDHRRMSAPSRGILERMREAPDMRVAAGVIKERTTRAMQLGLNAIAVNLPVFLRPSGLPAKLSELGKAGSKVDIIFSAGDGGIKELARQLGRHGRWLSAKGHCTIEIIAGPDHSFTPRWATDLLVQAIAKHVRSDS